MALKLSFAAVLLGLASIAASNPIYPQQETTATSNEPTTAGTVTAATETSLPDVDYIYQEAKKTYVSAMLLATS